MPFAYGIFGKVFGITPHGTWKEVTLVAIRDIDDNECLINLEGIEKATVSEIKNSYWGDSVDLRPSVKVGDTIMFYNKFEGRNEIIKRTVRSITDGKPVVDFLNSDMQYIVSWDYFLYKKKSNHAIGYVNVTAEGFMKSVFVSKDKAEKDGNNLYGKGNFKTIKINGKF